MKTLFKLIGILIIGIILTDLLVKIIDPKPKEASFVLILIAFVFILNLAIAGVLFFAKKKEYGKIFLINSILSTIIMFYIYGKRIDRYIEKQKKENTTVTE